jgi:hypothetical protein
MLTGRRVLFGTAPFVAPLAQGMVSWLFLRFSPCPGSHFPSHFFHGWKQHRSGEGAGSRARVFCAFIGAQRRPLTRLPRSVHSPAEKMGDFTPRFLFNKFACGNFRLLHSTLTVGFFS